MDSPIFVAFHCPIENGFSPMTLDGILAFSTQWLAVQPCRTTFLSGFLPGEILAPFLLHIQLHRLLSLCRHNFSYSDLLSTSVWYWSRLTVRLHGKVLLTPRQSEVYNPGIRRRWCWGEFTATVAIKLKVKLEGQVQDTRREWFLVLSQRQHQTIV